MTELIYGLPGTGKTALITNRIKDDVAADKKVLLIVPEQQTVEVERNMTRLLPASAQLTFEVVNFSRLANKLFRLYGGLSYNYITGGMKNLFMKRTLIELSQELSEYGLRAVGDSSLPSLMLAQINEFKINNVSATKLGRVADSLEDGHPLKAKLSDFSMIYSEFSGMVEDAYDDSSDDLEKLHTILCENRFFNGYNVYIDAFSSFTAWEYKIIERIFSQADNCAVTIPSDAPSCSALHLTSVNKTSQKLRAAAGEKAQITVLDTPHRVKSPSLTRLWRSLWDFSLNTKELKKLENDGAVSVIKCTDMYHESEAVANTVLSLLDSGYRCREIAVIAGDMDSYRGIIDSAFEKAGIPYFMSERTDLVTEPLISLILSAFAIKLKGWRSEDVIAYLKTGLTDISTADIDVFELYVSTWKISGSRFADELWSMNPDGYSTSISPRGLKILETANDVKGKLTSTLFEFFTRLDAANNVRELCEATYDFFKSLDLSQKLYERAKRAYSAGDRKTALECAGTHKAFVKVLSDISSMLGDSKMSVEEFASSLKLVLGNTDIATIPTAADEVLLGSASMLRASDIRCAILIGVCDGKFPAHVSDSGFFSDNEKKSLSELGIELSSNVAENSAEELLYVYRAVTLPSDKLILSYHSRSGGTAFKPSLAITRVLSLLPHIKIRSYGSENELDRLMSRTLSFEAFGSIKTPENRAALEKIFENDKEYREILKKSQIPISDPTCRLSDETADGLFGNNIHLSQTKIDKYIKCHFNYFCQYALELRENKSVGFNSANTGTFIHRLLEIFIKAVVDKDTVRTDLSHGDIESIIRQEAKKYIDNIFGKHNTPSKRLSHLFDRLTRLAVLVASALYKELLNSSFVPKYLEMKIGNDSKCILPSPVLTLKDGTKITLSGTVDRLDIFKTHGVVYVKVIDYKTGSKTFSINDIESGLNIQLLLYLFAICNTTSEKFRKEIGCENDDQIKPASAIYVSTALPGINTDYGTENERIFEIAESKIPRSGIVLNDENILKQLSHDSKVKGGAPISADEFDALEKQINETLISIAEEMKSGNADIIPRKDGQKYPCEYCNMKQFCRVDITKSDIDSTDAE